MSAKGFFASAFAKAGEGAPTLAMDLYYVILSAMIPVFLVSLAGSVAQWRGWMQEDLERGVMKLALNLLLPCLIFDLVVGNPSLDDPKVVGMAIGCGFGFIIIGFAVSWLVGMLFGLRRGFGRRTFTIAAGVQNYGFVALPVIAMLFVDAAGIAQEGPLALVFIHGLGVELAVWTIGVMILSRDSGPPWKLLINGPLIAVVVSLVVHYSGGAQFVPKVFENAVAMLGRCAIPMSLFMIGATIATLFERRVGRHIVRTAVAGSVARLAIMPAIMLSITALLPLPLDLKKVLVVQAGMPAALMPIVIARLYGGHPQTAIQVVLATMLLCIGTAPAVIGWGMKWLGL